MKAITTHYVGATSRKPARIIASDMDGNRITLSVNLADEHYPHDGAHLAAAVALCEKLQWTGAETLVGGAVKHGMVWVFPPAAATVDQQLARAYDPDNREAAQQRTRDAIERQQQQQAFERHRAADPHCTCNDCSDYHFSQQRSGEGSNEP